MSDFDPFAIAHAVELVTPDMAADWLSKHNTHNRRVRAQRVSLLEGDMRRGAWTFDAMPLRFAIDGTLLDGQHRLAAVHRSGIAQPFLIVRGLPASAQEAMDIVSPRSTGDTFSLRGYKNSTALAALCLCAFKWNAGVRKAIFTGSGVTSAQRSDFLDAHPELHDYAGLSRIGIERDLGMGRRILHLSWWLFDQIDKDDAAFFFERLCSEFGHEPENPISELRRSLLSAKGDTRSSTSPEWQLAMTIKAWNFYRDGASVKNLRWRRGGSAPESMPEPA